MFHCAHINVSSLTNSFDILQDHITANNYDIIGISESWLNGDILYDAVAIDNYSFTSQDRQRRGGGVGIYVRTGIVFENLLSECKDVIEQIWIKIRTAHETLIIGNIYRPPNSNIN